MWRVGAVLLLAVLSEYTWAQHGQQGRVTPHPLAYGGSIIQAPGNGNQQPRPSPPGYVESLHRHKREYPECPEYYPYHHHHPPRFWPPPPPGPPPYWPPPPPPPVYSQNYVAGAQANAQAQSQGQGQVQSQAQAQAQSQGQGQSQAQAQSAAQMQNFVQGPVQGFPQQATPCDNCDGKSSAISNAKSEYGDAIAVAIARAKKNIR